MYRCCVAVGSARFAGMLTKARTAAVLGVCPGLNMSSTILSSHVAVSASHGLWVLRKADVIVLIV